uniref:Uncharacterized protein LOC104247547 n=1 Tax=Nicotiana sylvestris TaxID=4096 RepID=A0A1U7YCQ4_NICSY|nr:PREDICTED: uncharacterized protein LOC104247547 [Nicotiana sylvestris]
MERCTEEHSMDHWRYAWGQGTPIIFYEKSMKALVGTIPVPNLWPAKLSEQDTTGTTWKKILRDLSKNVTTSKSSTGATPFSLVYGSEALIPIEVAKPKARFQHASEESNYEAMNASLKFLDEKREAALVRMAVQKQKIKRYYNRRTNIRLFGIRDLVLRKVTLNT